MKRLSRYKVKKFAIGNSKADRALSLLHLRDNHNSEHWTNHALYFQKQTTPLVFRMFYREECCCWPGAMCACAWMGQRKFRRSAAVQGHITAGGWAVRQFSVKTPPRRIAPSNYFITGNSACYNCDQKTIHHQLSAVCLPPLVWYLRPRILNSASA